MKQQIPPEPQYFFNEKGTFTAPLKSQIIIFRKNRSRRWEKFKSHDEEHWTVINKKFVASSDGEMQIIQPNMGWLPFQSNKEIAALANLKDLALDLPAVGDFIKIYKKNKYGNAVRTWNSPKEIIWQVDYCDKTLVKVHDNHNLGRKTQIHNPAPEKYFWVKTTDLKEI